MIKKLLTVVSAVAFILTAFPSAASAAQPPAGYPTDEYDVLIPPLNDLPEIPLRRGFWDPEKPNRYSKTTPKQLGEGFGLDKAEHKHNIKSPSLIEYVIRNGTRSSQLSEDEQDINYRFVKYISSIECYPNPYGSQPLCDHWDDEEYIPIWVIVEANYYDYYYDWPSGVNDEFPVGLLTAYCNGYPGKCPGTVNEWTGLEYKPFDPFTNMA